MAADLTDKKRKQRLDKLAAQIMLSAYLESQTKGQQEPGRWMTDKLKLIVGCGYLGLRVARRWIAAGHAVAGLVRSSAAAEVLAGEAVHPIVADVTQPSTLRDLPAADTLLYAVGYDPAGGTFAIGPVR